MIRARASLAPDTAARDAAAPDTAARDAAGRRAALPFGRQIPATGILPLLRRGALGGFVAYLGFGSIMPATRPDKVGGAAVRREI